MIKPLGNKVIIEILTEKKTLGGIILAQNAQTKSQIGKIIAVGEGNLSKENKLIPLIVKKGQSVLFSQYSGSDVEYKGKKYLVVKEDDILAIIEE